MDSTLDTTAASSTKRGADMNTHLGRFFVSDDVELTSTLDTMAASSTKRGADTIPHGGRFFISTDVDMTSPEEELSDTAAIRSVLSALTAASFEGDDFKEFLDELEDDVGEDVEGLLGLGFENDVVDEMEYELEAASKQPEPSSSEDVRMSDSEEAADEELTGTEETSDEAMVTRLFLREHSMDSVKEEDLGQLRGVDVDTGVKIRDYVAVGAELYVS